jgi:fermentation-respiration switch protein FrsA (DUF1100 family)
METEVFFSSGGIRCAADLYIPDDLEPGSVRPGLVIGHGFSVVKEGLVEQARYFMRAGFVVLAIDYRSFGRSEGEPRGQLFPMNEAEDYRNGISYLQSRTEVDAGRIGIWGTSFAGGLVLYVASVDRRVKAAVSQVPVVDGYRWMKILRAQDHWDELVRRLEEDRERRYAGNPSEMIAVTGRSGEWCALPSDQSIVDFFGQAKTMFSTWRDQITLESIERILEFSPVAVVDRMTPRPLMIVTTSGYDVVHPVDMVVEAYERAGEPKRLVLLPFDQLDLYAEPGMGIALGYAAEFFTEHLGMTVEERRDHEARLAQERRPHLVAAAR